ncbi:hypothetical protein NHP190012_05490 [Helicobacter sp. NHP19-012]|uniref:Uncharacterized protein n=1 Tax=Helicobacter gastrofelis TaxID=2849642 RepID=A0ABM7SGG5_9HELI|nr:hypothetical protein NHP190012_05490 [Helicobacter sp. NHP19-012]GMB96374.1 hypothetical protein NHP22001_09630 [Helicobacter sp. NHP22-001]
MNDMKEVVYKIARQANIIGLDALGSLNTQIKIEIQNERDILKVYETRYDYG